MSDTDAQSSDRYHIPNLVRALGVIELLAGSPPMSISDIAEQLDIPQNSAFRIATTLRDFGYLDRDPSDKTYRLSRKFLALGYTVVEQEGLISKSLDVLHDLRDATGETALLGAMLHDGGVVLEQFVAEQPIKVSVQIGHRFPLHTAAPSKAMLAFLPDVMRVQLLGKCDFHRFNKNTIVERDALLEELESVKANGYAFDRSEEVEGVMCVAAPVFDYRGQPVAAIWITGPAQRLNDARVEQVIPMVVEHACRISKRLGHEPLSIAS